MAARGVAGWARATDGGEPVNRCYSVHDNSGNVWAIDSETGTQALVYSPSSEARADALSVARAHAARMADAALQLDVLFGKAVH